MIADTARRLIDIIVAFWGLILLSPLFLLVAVLIKLDSPGTVFYSAERVGKDGRLFRLFKFRTMIAHAEKLGPGITVAGDSRVTRVGRTLRRIKIDEMPQLINVMIGEMSLVGPRPEDSRYVAFYTPDQRKILRVRPGITSPASLTFRYEEQILSGSDWEKTYCNKIMPVKLAIDLEYFSGRTLLSDLKLLMLTIAKVFR